MNKKKALLAITGICSVSAGLVVALANTGDAVFRSVATSNGSIVLDKNNAPVLTDGAGSMTDAKGVEWQYKKAQLSSNSHVALQDRGYMRVSPTAAYGIKGISSFTPVFTASGTDKLILLASEDGVEWRKFGALESGVASRWAVGYYYVGLLAETEESRTIVVNSLNIEYSCSSVSSFDDVDLALSSNVRFVANESSFAASDVTCNALSHSSFKVTATSEYSAGKYHQVNFNLFGGSTYDLDELIEKDLYLQFCVYSEWTTDSTEGHIVPDVTLTNDSVRLANGYNARPTYTTFTYNAKKWIKAEMSFAELKATAANGAKITGFRSQNKYLQNGESMHYDSIKIVGAPYDEYPIYDDPSNLTKKSAMTYHNGLHTAEITDTDHTGVKFDFENNNSLRTYSYFSVFNFGSNYTIGPSATQTMTIYFIDESLHLTFTDNVVTGVDRQHNGKAIRIDALSDAETGTYPKTYCHAPKLETLAVLVDERTGLYKVDIPLTSFVKEGMTAMNGIGLQTMYKQSDGVAYLSEHDLDTTAYFKLVHTSIAQFKTMNIKAT